ncbi:MAG: hypothetical protein U1E65_03435 [Myxococcota bacterium]
MRVALTLVLVCLGVLLEGCKGRGCISDTECDPGQVCKKRSETPGSCVPGCRSSLDCQVGYVCASQVCQPDGRTDAGPRPDLGFAADAMEAPDLGSARDAAANPDAAPAADAGRADGGADAGTGADAGAPDLGPRPDAGPLEIVSAWESYPLPGTNVHAASVWCDPSGLVQAISADGHLLRNDGSGWTQESDPSAGTGLADIWGSGPSDRWVVGDGVILRDQGTGWLPLTTTITDSFTKVQGSGPNEVWLRGFSGAVYYYDGVALHQIRGTQATQLAVAGPGDAYVANGTGLFRWNGTTFTATRAGNYSSVWASGPTDVWIGGLRGEVTHFDGVNYVDRSIAGETLPIDNFGGSGPNDVWATTAIGGLHHWDGMGWTDVGATAGGATRVCGSAANDLWAVGGRAGIYRYSGRTVREFPSGVGDNLNAVWASSPADVWAVGAGGLIMHYDGTGWAGSIAGGMTNIELLSVEGAGPRDVWAVGNNVVFHYDGTGWSMSSVPGSCCSKVRVLAGGTVLGLPTQPGPLIDLRTGLAMGVAPPDGTFFYDFWGLSSDDLFLVTNVGNGNYHVHRRQNGLWSQSLEVVGYLTALGGTAPDDVWVAGESVHHFDSASWTEVPSAVTFRGGAVKAFASTDVWIDGSLAALGHWDGHVWSTQTVVNFLSNGVGGTAPDDVWFVGGSGRILHSP